MKVFLLSGAYKNAGDFLIVRRGQQLLERLIPDCQITLHERRLPLEDKLNLMNGCDLAVLCGGPGYSSDFYPSQIPLVKDLSSIHPKLMALGMGWQSRRTDAATRMTYHFAAPMTGLLARIQNDTHILGCRDWFAVEILRRNGYSGATMTGCPAWYHPDFLDKTEPALTNLEQVRHIGISDPANLAVHGPQMEDLIHFLQARFPDAQLHVFFHRGTQMDANTDRATADHLQKIIAFLKREGVPYQDIAYGCEGFSSYDSCDLHIGFRVHAHIYNMSRRTPSFLLEEDCRGTGTNDAMGLPGLRAYSERANLMPEKVYRLAMQLRPQILANSNLLPEHEAQLDRQQDTGFWSYRQAYQTMVNTYGMMEQHVRQTIAPI